MKACVDSWANMGMYLPSQEQIDLIHVNLTDVAPALAVAISHEDPDVRQRAAYVIAEIGPDADVLGDSLLEQLKIEPERLVRIYLVDALAAIRFSNDEAIEFLEKKYEDLSSENVPEYPFDVGYADVDEKINLSGALYVLVAPESQGQYLDFVIQWLHPPSEDMGLLKTGGYWERRWMAVNSLESMEGAVAAIPLLESMLEEENAKSWVSVHVPRVLAALKNRAP